MAAHGELTELILKTLEERSRLDSYELAQEVGRDHQLLVGAIKSLHSLGDVSPCVRLEFHRVIGCKTHSRYVCVSHRERYVAAIE